jgi:hypothetical protein
MPSKGTIEVAAPAPVDREDYEDLVRRAYAPGVSDLDFERLLAESEHRGLSPVSGEIYAIPGFGKDEYGRDRPAIITPSIHGYRKLANASGLIDGTEGPFFCGPDGSWVDVWLDEKCPPRAAKFVVHRRDRSLPITAVVTWQERAGRNAKGELKPVWTTMPAQMLGKVAESDAYKRAGLLGAHSVDREDSEARRKAYGRLHAVAVAQGLSHDQARAVVAQLVPGMESLTDEEVDIDDIHDAASLIEAIGEEAVPDEPEFFAAEAVDSETGEILTSVPSEREEFRIRLREAIEAQDRAAVAALWKEAAEKPVAEWKWQDVIERASTLSMANRGRDLAVSAGVSLERADRWLQTFKDGIAVTTERRRVDIAGANAKLPGMPADHSRRSA